MKPGKACSLVVLLLTLLLGLSRCMDHDLAPLTLRTLPFTTGLTFQVEATELGSKPVTEFGIVYTAYFRASQEPHTMQPTLSNTKIVFPGPMKLGVNQLVYTSDFFGGRTFFYYRAYALLEGGAVVYGNSIGYRFPDPF